MQSLSFRLRPGKLQQMRRRPSYFLDLTILLGHQVLYFQAAKLEKNTDILET